MKAQINRIALLQALEAVEPGLSPRATVEQSNSIVFRNGFAFTYNDEVGCRIKTPLPQEMKIVVKGKPLLEIIRRLADETILVETGEGEFKIKGKRRSAGVRAESGILLPYGSVEKPGTWKNTEEEFATALSLVTECAGKDESQFALTCIRLTPKYVEACDNFHMMRYNVRTHLSAPFLILKQAAKHIAAVGCISVSETKNWVHFKNNEGLLLSCRRYEEDYPELGEHYKFRGNPTKFPGGTQEAADLAGVFSGENPDDDQLTVTLGNGQIVIRGDGVSGWASEESRIKYRGPELSFRISPKLLINIVEKHRECELSPDRLRAEGGSWVYLACLGVIQNKNGESHDDI